MDNPQISVLIPMYNRKHYISQCVDSALNQTFQENYEIIIRDDGSTDGGFEFVAEKYAKEISAGKIKLRRNEKNIGEFPTDNRLFREANAKYIAILHSDDMYLPYALQHLYEIAEKTDADVVHESFLLNSPPSGIINDVKDCKPVCYERTVFDEITVMPNDAELRFKEWINGGTFIDAQYNLFRKNFMVENEIFFDMPGNRYFALWWLMKAKVFVKTPIVCYIRREAPDSVTNSNFPPEKLSKFILNKIEMARLMDRHFEEIDFFKENKPFQYIAKAHLISLLDNFDIRRHKVFENGITPEIYSAVEKSFKKIFGENYFYPMFLFNWVHVMPHNLRVDMINVNPPAPPPSR